MVKGKILIVDDEPKVIHLVREILTASGYEVVSAINGQRAVELAAIEQPDLIVLDIMLSDALDGYEVTERIREFSDVPIIMLTAKVRESDLLKGFDKGADDYLTKPFSAKELMVRIKALLKRYKQENSDQETAEINCGDLTIDLLRHQVLLRGQIINLTPTEFDLLCELARHKNQVMLHEQLLSAVWGPEYRNDNDYLRAYIRYLRKKLEIDPSHPKLILRCPGVGYSLVCEET